MLSPKSGDGACTSLSQAPSPNFLNELLVGYGQALFAGQRRSGLLILAATLVWPEAALCSLLGALSAMAAGLVLPARDHLSGPGLYACNGALAGFAVGLYQPGSVLAPLGGALAGALAALVLFAVEARFAALWLPALSVPYCVAFWATMAILEAVTPDPWAKTLAVSPLGQPWTAAGLLALAAMLVHAPRQMLTALLAAILAAATLPPQAVLNAVVTVVALYGVFLPRRPGALAAALLAAALSAVLTTTLTPLSPLPILVAPFCIATQGMLLLVRHWDRHGRRPQPAVIEPLPALLESSVSLSPPFFGRWLVSQGPDGAVTHQGEGRHAWDFVVTGEDGRTHRNLGLHLEDYHAFGLPVRAAADGVVIAVVDGIPDNLPPLENHEDHWGNLVIMDHGAGEFTEISHFQCGSIRVAPGQPVARGQILGRCGSSGRSLEPHIHIQVQTGPYPGAPSLPTRFIGCRTQRQPSPLSPAQGDLVESQE